MGTELEAAAYVLVQPVTGEVVDSATTTNEEIVLRVTESQDTRRKLTEFESNAGEVLLERLDKDLSWTQRVGDPTTGQWEITAPSPDAGTETYPEDKLVPELQALIAEGTISPDGASRACERSLTLKLSIPWDADPKEIAQALEGELVRIQVAGHEMTVLSATPVVRSMAAGIKALRKIPGASEALGRVLVKQPNLSRRVKITEKTKARS